MGRVAKTNANLIWKIADLLRGPYQPNQYGDVILPFRSFAAWRSGSRQGGGPAEKRSSREGGSGGV